MANPPYVHPQGQRNLNFGSLAVPSTRTPNPQLHRIPHVCQHQCAVSIPKSSFVGRRTEAHLESLQPFTHECGASCDQPAAGAHCSYSNLPIENGATGAGRQHIIDSICIGFSGHGGASCRPQHAGSLLFSLDVAS